MTSRRTATIAAALALAAPLAALPTKGAVAQAPPATTPTTPVTTPPPTPPAASAHQVDLTATLRVRAQGSVFIGRGPFKGKPFTSGSLETSSRVKSRGPLKVTILITITARGGRVVLNATASATGSGLRGRASVASGTGAYRHVTGSNLALTITNGTVATLRLTGSVKFVDPTRPK